MTFPENTLKLSDNSKTKGSPSHYNTFGLMFGLPKDGGTCPMATIGVGGCLNLKGKGTINRTCYVEKLYKAYPSFAKVLKYNTELLRGKTQAEMELVLENSVSWFIQHNKGTKLYFRISTSGDFFSKEYTEAWKTTINKFPEVRFWVYTRSLSSVIILKDCLNLALYISTDNVNYNEAAAVFELYSNLNNVGICYMGNDDTLPKDERWVKCPEVSGRLKNQKDKGACAKCKLCFTYNERIPLRNIQFLIH